MPELPGPPGGGVNFSLRSFTLKVGGCSGELTGQEEDAWRIGSRVLAG